MARGRGRWLAVLAGALVGALSSVAAAQPGGFAGLMSDAMTRMDRDMMRGASGQPDHDFAAMMIPHHQGAIDMARAELVYGKDVRLRRLAQGIIVEQNQEIVVMRQILNEAPVASPPSQGAMR